MEGGNISHVFEIDWARQGSKIGAASETRGSESSGPPTTIWEEEKMRNKKYVGGFETRASQDNKMLGKVKKA